MDKVTEPAPMPNPTHVDKVDIKNDVQLEVTSNGDGQNLKIFIRAPLLAAVIRKMAPSNYLRAEYSPIYKPILVALADTKDRVVTRAAIAKATKSFVGGTDFLWEENPRAILLANPDKLEEGYELVFKVDTPIPPATIKKWGRTFIEGCGDILSAARPFKLSWVMQETPKIHGT